MLKTCDRAQPARWSAWWSAALGLLCLSALAGGGCADIEPGATPEVERPLRPLIYTEQPQLSASAVAVRERRLMRRLVENADLSGAWGELQAPHTAALRPPASADRLGRAVFDALVRRDEALWDAVFVAPEDYAALVRVELSTAREFVDDIQAKSLDVWNQLESERTSESREGGLGAVLEFAGLELGAGRTVAGPIAAPGEPVAQHWGNVLKLRLRQSDFEFELHIPKILRIEHTQADPRAMALVLGSRVELSRPLNVYLRAGMHLKPQLLEAREYPYPLAVGNFWRYERTLLEPGGAPTGSAARDGDSDGDALGALDEAQDYGAQSAGLAASETLLEVTAVDRFGTHRLVTLRRSYNDEALTASEQYLLVLPRRVYRCEARCRNNLRNLGALLDYLDQETPIFQFPLGLNQSWGAGGRSAPAGAGGAAARVFTVESEWRDVQTPAGTFANTAVIHGAGPLAAISVYYRGRQQTRYFAHGHGLIQRVLHEKSASGERAIVERLVESRIMPR